jgi:hypothetical protein
VLGRTKAGTLSLKAHQLLVRLAHATPLITGYPCPLAHSSRARGGAP